MALEIKIVLSLMFSGKSTRYFSPLAGLLNNIPAGPTKTKVKGMFRYPFPLAQGRWIQDRRKTFLKRTDEKV